MTSLLWLATNCSSPQNKDTAETVSNPAAADFNEDGSDAEAIAIADSVMNAMGGREAWDNLHFVAWNFFGFRDLVWDKETGRVRIDIPSSDETYLININDNSGKVFVGDSLITPADSLQKMINRGKEIWINDSYWLFMPFKLKDSGVTLNYMGRDTMLTGSPAEVLQLTFENVGVTPDNKYMIYVDPEDNLVKQWAYFEQADQDSANFVMPWDNYKRYGKLWISADRSDGRGPKNVRLYDAVPDALFEDPSFEVKSIDGL